MGDYYPKKTKDGKFIYLIRDTKGLGIIRYITAESDEEALEEFDEITTELNKDTGWGRFEISKVLVERRFLY